MTLTPVQLLGIAVGLGLLVGLQREHSHNPLAGIRTFPLITLLGTLTGLLAQRYGPWLPTVALAALVGLVMVGNFGLYRASASEVDAGLTTEVAVLTMFVVGLLLAADMSVLAIIVTGVVAVLLQGKKALHAFVGALSDADLWMVTRFALIALVILPLLPDRVIGPYSVLNPFEIWRIVVLIVSISLLAYVAGRLWGGRRGALLAGLLGGLVSSTATTVSYARRNRNQHDTIATFVVLIVASTVVFVRVLFEVSVVAPRSLGVVAPPLIVVMAVMALWSIVAVRRAPPTAAAPVGSAREGLGTAIVFGLLYAVILFAVAWARETAGQRGIYLVAGLSGLVDVDAITLSTAQLLNDGRLVPASAWRIILVGVMANLVFKGLIVVVLAGRRLARQVALAFGVSLAVGAALMLIWP